MAEPIGSFSGLASGIQWRDMVDQIMALEQSRRLSPVQSQRSARESRRNAWSTYGSLVARLKESAAKLKDASAFRNFTTTAGKTATGATLFSATASDAAQAGKYRIDVIALARAEKLNGGEQSSTSAALAVSGEAFLNGRRLDIAATDSLSSVRDKINALNSGTEASGVTATILTTSANSHRLILTADNSGSRGIELVDGATGALQSLGVLGASQARNASPVDSANTDTQRLRSKSAALASMLGVTAPPAITTIKIDGRKIRVDLATDTLISVMNRVNDAGGSASIVEEAVGGSTQYRLSVQGDATVDTDPDADAAASQRIVELMGFVQNSKASSITTGQDSRALIDGFTVSRRTNTVTDALSGVTLDLTGIDTAARSSTVAGAGLSLVTAAGGLGAGSYGISLSTSASSSQNSSTSSPSLAIANNPGGLSDGTYGVSLTTGPVRTTSASNGLLTNITAPATTLPGTYEVVVTRAATRSTVTGSVAASPYLGLTGDTISIVENGITGTYSLTNGQSLDSVVSGLNAMFASSGVRVSAENSGGRLKISNTLWGDDYKFTVKNSSNFVASSYGLGSTGGGTNYDNGIDIDGTIGGVNATGFGRDLLGDTSVVKDLRVTYTGTAMGPVGSVTVTDTTAVTGGTIGGQAATWNAATNTLTADAGGYVAGLAVAYTGPVASGFVGNAVLATSTTTVISGATIDGTAAVWDAATSTIRGATGSLYEGLQLSYTGPATSGSIGTLTVTGDVGADLTITRDLDSAVTAVQQFASAYNEVVAFADTQRQQGAGLHANGTLRAMLGTLKGVLLSDVPGLAGGTSSYLRGGMVGVALSKTGQLEVDTAVLKGALSSGLTDVVNLFSTSGIASDGEVSYRTSTTLTRPGTYAVDITTAATRASHTGAARGAGFTYTASNGVSDTLSITDAYSGATASYVVRQGEDLDTIISELNSAFGNSSMALSAEKSGTSLRIVGTQFGSARTFTLAGAEATTRLGLSVATYAGTDVQGTLGGFAATGVGQVLTASAGFATEGLEVTYTGSAARAAGTLRFARGIGGEMDAVADVQSRSGDGAIAVQTDVLDRSIELLNDRIDNLQARLELRREGLIRQFTRMEEAMSRFQAQSSTLLSQIGSLASYSNS